MLKLNSFEKQLRARRRRMASARPDMFKLKRELEHHVQCTFLLRRASASSASQLRTKRQKRSPRCI